MQNLFIEKDDEFIVNFSVATDEKGTMFCDLNRELLSAGLEVINIDVEKNNSTVKFKIKDTGLGIDEERVQSIFEVDRSKTTQGTKGEAGTGLGLIICKEFIEKNGGSISVESKVGEGSTFYFTLPV